MGQDKSTATRLVYERQDGTWGWRLRLSDGSVLATSGSNHLASEKEARRMADRVLGGTYKDATRRVRRRPEDKAAQTI